MSGAHTSGPWLLCHHLKSKEHDESCKCGYRGSVWGSDGEHIVCEMGATHTPGQEGLSPPDYERSVVLANARLIAAAPELLEALQTLLRVWPNTDKIPGWCERWSDAQISGQLAIAKATGVTA